jgi:hypothetical protein
MKIKFIGSELLWNYVRNPWNVNGYLDKICDDWKEGTSRKAPPQNLLGCKSKDILFWYGSSLKMAFWRKG